MKKVIIDSIKINVYGYDKGKTIFNIKNEFEKKGLNYWSLTKIKGLKTLVTFSYEEGEEIKSDKLIMIVPSFETDEEIRNNMVSEINIYINNI
jgi:hypothetical protein